MLGDILYRTHDRCYRIAMVPGSPSVDHELIPGPESLIHNHEDLASGVSTPRLLDSKSRQVQVLAVRPRGCPIIFERMRAHN
jgi:hypothetical protein